MERCVHARVRPSAPYAPPLDLKTFYPLLAVYGAYTATTTLPCFVYLWSYPTSTAPPTGPNDFTAMHPDQQTQNLYSFAPWLIIPLLIMFDFGWRSVKLIQVAEKVEAAKKNI